MGCGCVNSQADVYYCFSCVYFWISQRGLRASSTFSGFAARLWMMCWIWVQAFSFCLPYLCGPCVGKSGFADLMGSFLSYSSSFLVLLVGLSLQSGREWGRQTGAEQWNLGSFSTRGCLLMALSAPMRLSLSSKQMCASPLAKPTMIWLMAGLQHSPWMELSPTARDFTFLSEVVSQKWRQLSFSSAFSPIEVPRRRYLLSGLKHILLPGNLLKSPLQCRMGRLSMRMSHTLRVPSVFLVANLRLSSKDTMEVKSSLLSCASLTNISGLWRLFLVLKICSEPSRHPLNNIFPSLEQHTPPMPTYAPRASLHRMSVLWANYCSIPYNFCSMSHMRILPSADAVTNSL